MDEETPIWHEKPQIHILTDFDIFFMRTNHQQHVHSKVGCQLNDGSWVKTVLWWQLHEERPGHRDIETYLHYFALYNWL